MEDPNFEGTAKTYLEPYLNRSKHQDEKAQALYNQDGFWGYMQFFNPKNFKLLMRDTKESSPAKRDKVETFLKSLKTSEHYQLQVAWQTLSQLREFPEKYDGLIANLDLRYIKIKNELDNLKRDLTGYFEGECEINIEIILKEIQSTYEKTLEELRKRRLTATTENISEEELRWIIGGKGWPIGYTPSLHSVRAVNTSTADSETRSKLFEKKTN